MVKNSELSKNLFMRLGISTMVSEANHFLFCHTTFTYEPEIFGGTRDLSAKHGLTGISVCYLPSRSVRILFFIPVYWLLSCLFFLRSISSGGFLFR